VHFLFDNVHTSQDICYTDSTSNKVYKLIGSEGVQGSLQEDTKLVGGVHGQLTLLRAHLGTLASTLTILLQPSSKHTKL
jgi:hypothetical protein